MQMRSLTGDLTRALNLPSKFGLLVLSVSSEGAGAKLDLKGG